MQKHCVIFTSYTRGVIENTGIRASCDLVLCADGGYDTALLFGFSPDKVIGDLDSLNRLAPPPELLIRHNSEKDDTDTMLCARYAIEQGCTICTIIGGIGGRLDHTLANIQTLAYLNANGVQAYMEDEYERVFLLENDSCEVPGRSGAILSLFAYTNECEVSISGVKYPLTNAKLTSSFPLGISNELIAPSANICAKKGVLLVVIEKGPVKPQ